VHYCSLAAPLILDIARLTDEVLRGVGGVAQLIKEAKAQQPQPSEGVRYFILCILIHRTSLSAIPAAMSSSPVLSLLRQSCVPPLSNVS
jgi:hypothetical protein